MSTCWTSKDSYDQASVSFAEKKKQKQPKATGVSSLCTPEAQKKVERFNNDQNPKNRTPFRSHGLDLQGSAPSLYARCVDARVTLGMGRVS
jgi:hypothetical protein